MSCCPPSPPPSLEEADAIEALAALTRAMGHPLRVRILRILAQRGACICGDLVEVLPVAQSTVSQHLKVLKEAGLIMGEVDGPRVCYCLDEGRLAALRALFDQLFPNPVKE